jgi:exodeoxyribonuclease-3
MIKISTFNVNSIRARLPRLEEWLKKSAPDIVCLQELKCEEQNFPFEAMLDLGYNSAVFGQKTYNGVAILSKFKIEEVIKGLPNFSGDSPQPARYIEAVISVKDLVLRVASIYVPNGGGEIAEGQALEDTTKFQYKMQFFKDLRTHLQKLSEYDESQIFAGDFNVANNEIDIYDPKKFHNQILFHPQERAEFRQILNLGLTDSFRMKNPQAQAFSWWDYRGNSYENNKGARIDYILTTANLIDRISTCEIEDKNVRDQEKPSDHCPVSIMFR